MNTKAYAKVEYEINGEGAAISGCFGDTRMLALPEVLDGKRVTEIGAYAFSASFGRTEAKKRWICELHPEWKIDDMGEEKRICGDKLEGLYLPPSVEKIGRYAFYGCSELKVFSMTDNLIQVEGGAFVGCRKLKRLEMRYVSGGPGYLKQVLEEVPFELETVLMWKNHRAVAVFPEFYEESVENTPARIIEIHLHGSGSHYRQCFQNGQLDFAAYDRLFPFAIANENPDVVGRIAFARLSSPYQLSPEAREKYIEYLREHIEMAARQILMEDNLTGVKLLAETGILTADNIELVLGLSLKLKKAECTAFLMNLPFHKARRQKKNFEL